jgi:hypothetical protein
MFKNKYNLYDESMQCLLTIFNLGSIVQLFVFISTTYRIRFSILSFKAIFCSTNPDDLSQLLRITDYLTVKKKVTLS